MVMIDVGDPKMAREHIALLQHAVAFGKVEIQVDQAPMMSPIYKMLSDMLKQLDEHRPLGVDGKHGDLHTPTCGCDPETVERFLQRKIDQNRDHSRKTSDGGWETADGDYSYYD